MRLPAGVVARERLDCCLPVSCCVGNGLALVEQHVRRVCVLLLLPWLVVMMMMMVVVERLSWTRTAVIPCLRGLCANGH